MKRRKKTGRVISRGKPPTNSVEAFLRRYTVEKELRSGMVVRDKKTNGLLKVYGDKHGKTVEELYAQRLYDSLVFGVRLLLRSLSVK